MDIDIQAGDRIVVLIERGNTVHVRATANTTNEQLAVILLAAVEGFNFSNEESPSNLLN